MTRDKSDSGQSLRRPVVGEVGTLSPHDKALLEAGKQLLVESVATGREFCKFMIGASVSAIPVYLGLLKLVSPESYRPTPAEASLAIAPAALFLAAATLFIVGFFPQRGSFSLDLPDEIERERTSAARHRQRWATTGFVLYAIAILSGVAVASLASTLPAPEAEPKAARAAQPL